MRILIKETDWYQRRLTAYLPLNPYSIFPFSLYMYTFCTMVYVHFFWTVHSTLTLGFLTEREVLSYTAYMYAVKCLVSRGLLRGEFEGCKQPQRSLQLTRWCCCCSRTAVSFAGSAWKTESGFFIEGRRVFFFLARFSSLLDIRSRQLTWRAYGRKISFETSENILILR